jgi:hypothetical protein
MNKGHTNLKERQGVSINSLMFHCCILSQSDKGEEALTYFPLAGREIDHTQIIFLRRGVQVQLEGSDIINMSVKADTTISQHE